MSAVAGWVIFAVLLGAGELHSGGFYLAPFALGALGAVVGAAAGAAFGLQVIIFLAVSGGTFALVRPIARRHLKTPPRLKTGTAALVGRQAQVVELVDREHGSVRLEGEVWTARAYLEDDAYEPGTYVHVIEIRGATALVSD